MDREEESVCCQQIPACVSINQESAEFEGIAILECITDNPVFLNIYLNFWVLRLAWSQYRQQYDAKAFKKALNTKNIDMLHIGNLLGGVGKEIRVPFPSCVVSCIRAHFPPPGLEEDFVFEGFKFADEW